MRVGLTIFWLSVPFLIRGDAVIAAPADERLTEARRLAEGEGRYDQAEQLLIESIEGSNSGAAALQLAAMYEQLGEIEAAATMYQRGLDAGGLDEPARERIASRLERCRRERLSLIRFPVSVEAETETRQFERLLEAQQWTPAFIVLNRIMERFRGTFLQRGDGHYVSVWAWARSMVDGLPAEGGSAYMEASRGPWQRALIDGSEEAYRGFLSGQPGSVVASPALSAWADTLADEGHDLLARSLHERILPGAGTGSPSAGLNAEPGLPDDLDAGWTVPWDAGETLADVGIAVSADRVFLHHRFMVEARERATGRQLWSYRPVEPAGRQDVRRPAYGKTRMPRSRWAGLLDPPAVVACPAGVLVVEHYHTGETDEVESVLTCLDEVSGEVRWQPARDALFSGRRVCGDPVYAGGKVFVAAASSGQLPEFSLWALDGEDGRVLWRQAIAASPAPTRCLGRGVIHAGWSGPLLAMDGSTLFYATQMGAVVAVDGDLGQLLWATSYPRVVRCGPLTHGALPLLERRTEPMLIAGRHLVLLPRDVNGLLVLDRSSGLLARSIRSLDLTGLIAADDERAVVSTLSGELRAYDLDDGSVAWTWTPPAGTAVTRAVRSGGDVLVAHGTTLTRIAMATGVAADAERVPEGAELRGVASSDLWTMAGADQLRVLTNQKAPATSTQQAVPDPSVQALVACAAGADGVGGWRHEAYIGPPGSQAKMLSHGGVSRLIVASALGLAAYDPDNHYRQVWRQAFDAEAGIWEVPTDPDAATDAAGGTRTLLAYTEDRETVQLLDALSGEPVASGRVEQAVPIKGLRVSGRHVLVAGTSVLVMMQAIDAAGLAGGGGAGLRQLWQREDSPRTYEALFVGERLTTLLVQPGGGSPGQLIVLDTATGELDHAFAILSPDLAGAEPPTSELRRRFPVATASYDQEEVIAGDGHYSLRRSGADDVYMAPYPIRLLGRGDGDLFIESGEYWGMLEPDTGRVTWRAPTRGRRGRAAQTPEEARLRAWIDAHPRLFREQRPQAVVEGGDLQYVPGQDEADTPDQLLDRLVLDAGGRLLLEGLRTQRIDRAGARLIVHGEGGIVVIGRAGGDRAAAPRPGKMAGDLFEPPGARPGSADGLVLDGDLSDWPADGWSALSPDRHAWPAASMAAETGREDVLPEASFQWAQDASSIWLAVKVESDLLVAHSAAGAVPKDGVEVLVTGYKGNVLRPGRTWEQPGPAVVSLGFADSVCLGTIRWREGGAAMGRLVGSEGLFESWWARRYGVEPLMDEGVRLAGTHGEGQTGYELRMDRARFTDDVPAGFDIRVTRGAVRLEWGGALALPVVFPPAPLLNGN